MPNALRRAWLYWIEPLFMATVAIWFTIMVIGLLALAFGLGVGVAVWAFRAITGI